MRTKPSSKDDLLFKNKFQLVIDPHVMIKLSFSIMKNGRKQTPSYNTKHAPKDLDFLLLCLFSFEITIEHWLSSLKCYYTFEAPLKLNLSLFNFFFIIAKNLNLKLNWWGFFRRNIYLAKPQFWSTCYLVLVNYSFFKQMSKYDWHKFYPARACQ